MVGRNKDIINLDLVFFLLDWRFLNVDLLNKSFDLCGFMMIWFFFMDWGLVRGIDVVLR